jgi:hypothetical protein
MNCVCAKFICMCNFLICICNFVIYVCNVYFCKEYENVMITNSQPHVRAIIVFIVQKNDVHAINCIMGMFCWR